MIFIILIVTIRAWNIVDLSIPLSPIACQSYEIWTLQSVPLIRSSLNATDCVTECCDNQNCLNQFSKDGRDFFGIKENTVENQNQFIIIQSIILCFASNGSLAEFNSQTNQLRNIIAGVDLNGIWPIVPNRQQVKIINENRKGFGTTQFERNIDGITRKYLFIYGGIDQNDQIINNVWIYQVAWAPQVYFNGVDRGNYWTQLDLQLEPRAYYGMTNNDKFIFIHGGTQSGNNLISSFIQIAISNYQIQTLPQKVIISVKQEIKLWDGNTSQFTFDDQLEIQEILWNFYSFTTEQKSLYTIQTQDVDLSSCLDQRIPLCIANHSLLYIEECNCIYLFFGNYQSNKYFILQFTSIDQTYNQAQWIYYIELNAWRIIVQQELTAQPPPRISPSIIKVSQELQ